MPTSAPYRPDPRHQGLGEAFYDVVEPAVFPAHTPRFRNQRAAAEVGLEGLDEAEWIDHMARFSPLPGNLERPLALRYHGHQFMAYNARLGDGRGFLYAQLRDRRGRLLDLGTKGSGETPWSRGGDGRLTLQGGVREVLAAELLEALGVDTCRVLSVVETGERLQRHDEPSPARSCVLVRLSHGHLRFGTFQRLAYYRQREEMQALLEYSARVYLPHTLPGAPEDLPARFLREVGRRTAETCAAWIAAGFVHGVLNTDNLNITGESFDYGPWRFLPTMDPWFTAAYFDHSGLYAFGRQPTAARWNLGRLADALTSITTAERLEGALADWEAVYTAAVQRALVRRLGLTPRGDDGPMIEALIHFLSASQVGYAQLFHDWYGGLLSRQRASEGPAGEWYRGSGFEAWLATLEDYEPAAPERLAAPWFQRELPCDLLNDEVRALWAAIAREDDWGPFHRKIEEIRALGAALRG